MDEDILEEMDDFDDESMEDILDDSLDEIDDSSDEMEDSLADSLNEIKDEKKESLMKKVLFKVKAFFSQVLGSKKVIIIIAISLVLFLSLIIISSIFFFKEKPEDGQERKSTIVTEKDIKSTLEQKDDVIFEDIIDLAPFERIELKTSSTMSLISMNLSLELTDHRFRKQIYTMEDRIRKIIVGQAEEMTWLELRNPEGKIMLKYNLLKRINSIFPKPTVRNIYFTYFIMQ
ncbi:MAG: flagellar basal body-associated FliL family protein [Desulfobacteraceae bacterium]|nr:flagellar basal body-associated FliL family protein [Desulfobacteraceae bacterium]